VEEPEKTRIPRRQILSALSKKEAVLKSDFVTKCKQHMRGAVVFRHEDVRTAGIPDMSITWNNMTSWWEAKHATPRFASTGIQELTLSRLAANGFARYLIWYETAKTPKQTWIVHPINISEYASVQEVAFYGFNTEDLIEHIRRIHETRGE
jgi:hypothetical protein